LLMFWNREDMASGRRWVNVNQEDRSFNPDLCASPSVTVAPFRALQSFLLSCQFSFRLFPPSSLPFRLSFCLHLHPTILVSCSSSTGILLVDIYGVRSLLCLLGALCPFGVIQLPYCFNVALNIHLLPREHRSF